MNVCDDYIKNVKEAKLLEEKTSDINDVVSFDTNDNFFNNRYSNSVVYYISDIHLDFKINEKIKNGATSQEIENYIDLKAKELVSSIDIEKHESRIILFGGDLSSSIELSKHFYSKFIKAWDDSSKKEKDGKRIPILGNHEFWEFDSVDKCVSSYRKMFDDLGITFLNNDAQYAFKPHYPLKLNEKSHELERLTRKDDPVSYDFQKAAITNVVIAGSVGYAGYNNVFNANDSIYLNALSREQEKQLTIDWEMYYKSIVDRAKKENSLLLVFTHNPPDDWKKDKVLDENCVYIYGHNHRNYLCRYNDSNVHIYADNQIGYKNEIIKFKKTYVYQLYNPFASYGDGRYKISPYEYLKFNMYSGVYLNRVNLIQQYIDRYNLSLYLIKKSGYYGFFLAPEKRIEGNLNSTYICVGGSIKKAGVNADLDYFENQMTNMVKAYIKMFKPYRYAQERISKAIKSFGGDGRIHGYIIDVSFYSHVMINPNDGKITYYYSPAFGLASEYNTIVELLENHNPEMADRYKKLLSKEKDLFATDISKTIHPVMLQKIDIKNSLYKESKKANQIQRLFDAHILRSWDDNILFDQKELKCGEENTIMLIQE